MNTQRPYCNAQPFNCRGRGQNASKKNSEIQGSPFHKKPGTTLHRHTRPRVHKEHRPAPSSGVAEFSVRLSLRVRVGQMRGGKHSAHPPRPAPYHYYKYNNNRTRRESLQEGLRSSEAPRALHLSVHPAASAAFVASCLLNGSLFVWSNVSVGVLARGRKRESLKF